MKTLFALLVVLLSTTIYSQTVKPVMTKTGTVIHKHTCPLVKGKATIEVNWKDTLSTPKCKHCFKQHTLRKDTVVGKTPQGQVIYRGPKGGRYILLPNGNKKYLPKK